MDHFGRTTEPLTQCNEVAIGSEDRKIVLLRPLPDSWVGCFFQSNIPHVNHTRKQQFQWLDQPRQEVLIQEEAHSKLVLRPFSAANWSTAGKSAFSRSGCSSRISSSVIPAPSHPSTSQTVMRKPRTHGFPPRLSGSMVILVLTAEMCQALSFQYPIGWQGFLEVAALAGSLTLDSRSGSG